MRRLALLLTGLAALIGGCLGGLRHDPVAESITLSARNSLGLPVRENRPYWLLRAADGWYSAHEIRYGGDPADPVVATIRAVRFRDDDTAHRAFARLTPAYLYSAFRDRMTGPPYAFDYPASLAGDETATFLYPVRLPPDAPADAVLLGQLTVIRAGATVFLVESIGVPPEQLVPAVDALVRAAWAAGGAHF